MVPWYGIHLSTVRYPNGRYTLVFALFLLLQKSSLEVPAIMLAFVAARSTEKRTVPYMVNDHWSS
jgi:hypothetical protein